MVKDVLARCGAWSFEERERRAKNGDGGKG